MKRRLFSILAAVSLLLAGLIASGYGVHWGFAIIHVAGGSTISGSGQWDVSIGEGRFRALYSGGGVTGGRPAIVWERPKLRGPDLGRSLNGFDAHLVNSTAPLTLPSFYLLACPLWCFIGPLLILPTLWWRRHRREHRRESRGFAAIVESPVLAPSAVHSH